MILVRVPNRHVIPSKPFHTMDTISGVTYNPSGQSSLQTWNRCILNRRQHHRQLGPSALYSLLGNPIRQSISPVPCPLYAVSAHLHVGRPLGHRRCVVLAPLRWRATVGRLRPASTLASSTLQPANSQLGCCQVVNEFPTAQAEVLC